MFDTFRNRRQTAARPARRTHLGIAHLESRDQPSVTASVLGNTLFVAGSAGSTEAEIRIAGVDQQVRVFDGQKAIAEFKGVTAINVQPDAGTNVAVDLGTNRGIGDLTVRMADEAATDRGGSAVRIGPGTVGNATILGGSGDQRVSVSGLTAGRITADLGIGADELVVGKSSVKALVALSTETVGLFGSTVHTVGVEHAIGATDVTTDSAIGGNLTVLSRGGALNVGGTVGGNVYFNADARALKSLAPAANLNVTGQIVGDLSMSGTFQGDSVNLAAGSRVAGNLAIDLRAGNDSLIFAGAVGNPKGSTLVVHGGAGDDAVVIQKTAQLQAGKAAIDLGEGNDHAAIELGAAITALYIDGGTGKDVYLNQIIASDVIDDVNFEVKG